MVNGRYEVKRLLGRGGQCAVFSAQDRETGRPVAMKVLSPEVAASRDLLARFDREATIGKQIAHPNIAAVFDKGKLDDGSRYFTMELLDGSSLDDELARGPIPCDRAVWIATQVLSGLEAAHKLGITHRDIKPANVMLVRDGRREVVKIVDFGIASNERAAVKLTIAGIPFGTPEYISPEMAAGVPVDARADLYSLGVMLFEMVTGKLPFTGDNAHALLLAHAVEAVPSPTKVAPGARIPAALESVIVRAMAKMPDHRYASADEMRVALARSLPVRRTGRWIAAALLVSALAASGVWWMYFRPIDEAATVEEPATNTQPKPAVKKKHRRPKSPAN